MGIVPLEAVAELRRVEMGAGVQTGQSLRWTCRGESDTQFFGLRIPRPDSVYPRTMGPINVRSSDQAQSSAGAGTDERRRQELAEFLRSRRAALLPEQVGLPTRRHRRTAGLRREDVAERAGVSTAWYTYLEQARPISPSRSVVMALADALCLNEAERAYLFSLSDQAQPHIAAAAPDGSLLQGLLDRLSAPAYCTDALTNVLAWNRGACEVFGDYSMWPDEQRNLLRLLFLEPAFADRLKDRAEYAARIVGTFRDRSDAPRNDPDAIALVEDLRRGSPEFRRLWDSTTLRRAGSDMLEAQHPEGLLKLTLVIFQDLGHAGVRFNAYIPADAATSSILDG